MGGAGWDSKEQSWERDCWRRGVGHGEWLVGGGEGRRGRPTPVPSPAPERTRPVLGDSLYQ